METESSDSPFARVEALQRSVRERAQHETADGAQLIALAEAARLFERVSHWAAEMQLGAEGFDNTASAKKYGDVQSHLHRAADAILWACESLRSSIQP